MNKSDKLEKGQSALGTLRKGPEEVVRQDYIRILMDDYCYKPSEIESGFSIPRGSSNRDQADIAIFDGYGRDPASDIVGIVETKKPGETKGVAQLKSYMTATSAIWGVWTNGNDIRYLCKPVGQSSIFEGIINNIPVRGQRVQDIGSISREDLRPYSRTLLKASFSRILNTLYANTNISRREKLGNEMIKIIFSKIHDETTYVNSAPRFYAGYGESPDAVKSRIEGLFKSVVDDYKDDELFLGNEKLLLDAKGVAWVVGQLERGSLTETPTDVVGDAFEVFAESKFVGEKGEFFTPRGVINIAIKMIAPDPDKTICDPACGSGGFLIAAMRDLWKKMETSSKWNGLDDWALKQAKQRMAAKCFFGIDKEIDLVRIAKAYMAISGDGKSNIVHENSLHVVGDFSPESAMKFADGGSFKKFDYVLTNPPYGTKTRILPEDSAHFDLGYKWTKSRNSESWTKGKPVERNPYVLFIERCLDMLVDNGQLAIVLPESAFHAPSMAWLRDYISKRGRVEAMVDLPHNTFRPHCNAKTCLLIFRKGAPASDGDRVIMAEGQEMGHDHNGKEIYRPGTTVLWDDLKEIVNELDDPFDESNKFVWPVVWRDLKKAKHWIPRYFSPNRFSKIPAGCSWICLGDLVKNGCIQVFDGHGSPTSSQKGNGDIPYIRVSDIVNWELYRNPTSGIDKSTYKQFSKKRVSVQAEDIIFVRRGSYRIGTVAMASPRDTGVILTRELLTLRVSSDKNSRLSPYYLLALLSQRVVQDQIERLTFLDTTLPNIGDRWQELLLPFHDDKEDAYIVEEQVKKAIQSKWKAQNLIDELRDQYGGMTT